LGPEELDRANPDLVITRISAFGQTGPMAGRPGFAAVAEAVGGLRELVGDPDRPPVRVGVSIGDSIAGIYAAFGTVMALFHRNRVAEVPLAHRVIDVALNESVLSMMESLVPDHLAYGVTRQRVGGRMEGIAPSNAYPCSDGASIVVAGNGDGIFGRYMRLIGRDDLADDPDLQTNAGRWRRRDELDDAIAGWTRRHSRDEALALLGDAGVPSGPIYTAADICADEQYKARNMIQSFDVDTGDGEHSVGFPGIVPVVGGASLPIRTVGPDLGEHTRDVLSSLSSLTEAELDRLAGPVRIAARGVA
jgi:formyl-CoA transferase